MPSLYVSSDAMAKLQLKAFRHARGLSIRQLAARSSIGPATIFRIEHGLFDPRLNSLIRLAKALDCSLAELLGETAPKRPRTAKKRRK